MDYQKLVKQEPAFEEFAKNVTFKVLLKTDPKFLNVIYSFYQSGLDVEQTINALATFMKIHESL